jgi:hypothetical protein
MRKREYFIGVDAHSKNCFFVVMNARGQVLQRHKVSTNRAVPCEYLGNELKQLRRRWPRFLGL